MVSQKQIHPSNNSLSLKPFMPPIADIFEAASSEELSNMIGRAQTLLKQKNISKSSNQIIDVDEAQQGAWAQDTKHGGGASSSQEQKDGSDSDNGDWMGESVFGVKEKSPMKVPKGFAAKAAQVQPEVSANKNSRRFKMGDAAICSIILAGVKSKTGTRAWDSKFDWKQPALVANAIALQHGKKGISASDARGVFLSKQVSGFLTVGQLEWAVSTCDYAVLANYGLRFETAAIFQAAIGPASGFAPADFFEDFKAEFEDVSFSERVSIADFTIDSVMSGMPHDIAHPKGKNRAGSPNCSPGASPAFQPKRTPTPPTTPLQLAGGGEVTDDDESIFDCTKFSQAAATISPWNGLPGKPSDRTAAMASELGTRALEQQKEKQAKKIQQQKDQLQHIQRQSTQKLDQNMRKQLNPTQVSDKKAQEVEAARERAIAHQRQKAKAEQEKLAAAEAADVKAKADAAARLHALDKDAEEHRSAQRAIAAKRNAPASASAVPTKRSRTGATLKRTLISAAGGGAGDEGDGDDGAAALPAEIMAITQQDIVKSRFMFNDESDGEGEDWICIKEGDPPSRPDWLSVKCMNVTRHKVKPTDWSVDYIRKRIHQQGGLR